MAEHAGLNGKYDHEFPQSLESSVVKGSLLSLSVLEDTLRSGYTET